MSRQDESLQLIKHQIDIDDDWDEELNFDSPPQQDRPINLSKPSNKYHLQAKRIQYALEAEAQFDKLLGQTTLKQLTKRPIVIKHGRKNKVSSQTLPLTKLQPQYGLDLIAPQFTQQWIEIYNKVRPLFRNKSSRGKRNWVDYQQRLIVEFIEKGHSFGLSRQKLMDLVGVSRVSWHKWYSKHTPNK